VCRKVKAGDGSEKSMRKLLPALALLLLLMAQDYEKPQPALWVEVHDLSPGYTTEEVERLLQLLEGRAERVVLFVIPDRDSTEPISRYAGFLSFLKEAAAGGTEIGAHGYTHRGFEFLTSGERAEALVSDIRREFRAAGFEPRIFSPPRYLLSPPALQVLSREFQEVFLIGRIVTHGGTLPYPSREFTPGRMQKLFMPLAKLSLLTTGGEVYRLSVHMAYLNNESLLFLEDFISWAGFEAGKSCTVGQELLQEARRMEPPGDVRGVKRNAYALLYAANMYTATREDRYLAMAHTHASYLLERQLAGGGWREVEGETTSSYSLLETAVATWALSQAYTAGAISGMDVERSILRAGDALLRRTELLTSLGYSFGLKPNAIGFAALALERVSRAAQEMGDARRAERYRRKAVEIGDGLVRMQLENGAWYDGPYRLPGHRWRSISSWYQGMALSGVVAAYAASEPGERLKFLESARKGIAFIRTMRHDGGYWGVLHPNRTRSGDGSVMVLQALAIANSFGVRAGCDGLKSTASRVGNWDANYAFAVSQLLATQKGAGKRY